MSREVAPVAKIMEYVSGSETASSLTNVASGSPSCRHHDERKRNSFQGSQPQMPGDERFWKFCRLLAPHVQSRRAIGAVCILDLRFPPTASFSLTIFGPSEDLQDC